MEENEDIKEAKEELDKISQDDLLRRMALKADLAQRDHEQLMYEAERDGRELGLKLGREEGRQEGRQEGKAEGIKEGEKKAKLEDARKMLEEELTLEQIMRITGLTKEEIMEDMETSKK